MTSPNEIGYFRVTDREFSRALEASKLDENDILGLPRNGVIVEIGSGLSQNFANETKKLRPDLKVISLDPTLGIHSSDFFTTHERNKEGKLEQVSYTYFGKDSYYEGKTPEYADPPEISKTIGQERITQANETGNVVSGLAPEIPFASNSIDMLIDLWGPGLYLERYSDGSQLQLYLENVIRVLKQGGEAIIYPIDYYNEALEENSIRNTNAKKEYSKILKEFVNIDIEFYEQEDSALQNKENQIRIGIKIKKHLM